MSKNGIGDACSTADIIDCLLVVYLWSTSGLVVSQTATDHYRMLSNALMDGMVWMGLDLRRHLFYEHRSVVLINFVSNF